MDGVGIILGSCGDPFGIVLDLFWDRFGIHPPQQPPPPPHSYRQMLGSTVWRPLASIPRQEASLAWPTGCVLFSLCSAAALVRIVPALCPKNLMNYKNGVALACMCRSHQLAEHPVSNRRCGVQVHIHASKTPQSNVAKLLETGTLPYAFDSFLSERIWGLRLAEI